MMKDKGYIYFVILLFSISGIQCKSTQIRSSRNEEYQRIYLREFKLTYLEQMLYKSYNASSAIKEILNLDHSGFTELILSEQDYKLIDSVTTAHNEIMKIDSIQGYLRAEGAQGKRPFDFIIDKIESKWLDSLARHRLR